MNMIERAAKAIYEGRNGRGCKAWGHLPRSHQEPYLADARAVLGALREPTPGMHKAAWEACDRVNEFVAMNDKWADYNGRVYRAMIDVALNEDV